MEEKDIRKFINKELAKIVKEYAKKDEQTRKAMEKEFRQIMIRISDTVEQGIKDQVAQELRKRGL